MSRKNNENHENIKIQCENKTNHKSHIISRENQENFENYRIACENHVNH